MTMVKRTNAGGRTKGADERSIVFVHQHGGDDVTCKPPIPIKIPLKLFLEGIDFLTDNVTSRVAWKLRGGGKVQKHVGISL